MKTFITILLVTALALAASIALAASGEPATSSVLPDIMAQDQAAAPYTLTTVHPLRELPVSGRVWLTPLTEDHSVAVTTVGATKKKAAPKKKKKETTTPKKKAPTKKKS